MRSMARSKSVAMGPAIRSARARKASASMRTTFSAVFFMRGKIARSWLGCYRRSWDDHSVGIEYQNAFGIRAPFQRHALSVERNFNRAGVAGPKNNLVRGVDGLYVVRTDNAAHRIFSI